VLLTRTQDVFVPLPDRTVFANAAKADFLISLHVNGARKRGAEGFETFFFSREPSDSDARASAQRENVPLEASGAGSTQDALLRATLADMAVTRDMKESSTLAEELLAALDGILPVQNRGVRSGPFYVLATAAMPAVLVESAFITNPGEERALRTEAYRARLAEALFDGIARYKIRYDRRVGRLPGTPPGTGS
jgi:N-acetylmuramoyl-L-alanine amidase